MMFALISESLGMTYSVSIGVVKSKVRGDVTGISVLILPGQYHFDS